MSRPAFGRAGYTRYVSKLSTKELREALVREAELRYQAELRCFLRGDKLGEEVTMAMNEEELPTFTCAGCGSEIMVFPTGMNLKPFSIVVRHPEGTEYDGGFFCGECLTKLVMTGVRLYGDLRAQREHEDGG